MADQNIEAEEKASSGALMAAGLSVLYSLYLFYIQGERSKGIFVGLWAPTILTIASYVEQTDLTEKAQNELDA
ncbi:hypothetical protein [Halococcus salsus]|uniref:hypothetical protein n=1 Tax=Halococcus salsus TaxID=2162894 RepID=UPI001357BB88|nr:hypothetical protein [Halococcus salsus]